MRRWWTKDAFYSTKVTRLNCIAGDDSILQQQLTGAVANGELLR